MALAPVSSTNCAIWSRYNEYAEWLEYGIITLQSGARAKILGHYVALYQGRVVDADPSEDAATATELSGPSGTGATG